VKHALVLIALFIVTLQTRIAGAVPVVEDKEKDIKVNVGVLVQPTFQLTAPASDGTTGCGNGATQRCSAGIGNPRGDGPSYDFFLRRARLMVWGTASKEIGFFVDTEEANLGKGGTFSTFTFIQDAFLTYSFMPELRIDAGLMLVPLSHHTLEGATSLNALDYHADLVRFPTGRIFRDVGVQLRGLALNDMLHYRFGIFEGVRNATVPQPVQPAPPAPPVPLHATLNGGGIPRFTLHVRGNLLGSEPDFFFKGIYFSETPIISLGVGADYQPKAVFKYSAAGDAGDYFAASGDVFVEYPFSAADEIIFKANYFFYAKGATGIGNSNLYAGGNALYAELGFRHDFIEPVIFADVLKGNRESISIIAPHLGVNFWVVKHNFNVKTDLGYKKTERKNQATQKDFLWTTQAQLFF
jgi:hypothetical protein